MTFFPMKKSGKQTGNHFLDPSGNVIVRAKYSRKASASVSSSQSMASPSLEDSPVHKKGKRTVQRALKFPPEAVAVAGVETGAVADATVAEAALDPSDMPSQVVAVAGDHLGEDEVTRAKVQSFPKMAISAYAIAISSLPDRFWHTWRAS